MNRARRKPLLSDFQGSLLVFGVLALALWPKGARASGVMTGDRLGRLTLAEIRALAVTVGFPDPDMAAAVAYAESEGFPHVRGDCGNSVGLWQVNLPSHPGLDANALTDPAQNAHAAFVISQSGTNWRPWSTAWEDADKRLGFLGPKAPFQKYMPAKGASV